MLLVFEEALAAIRAVCVAPFLWLKVLLEKRRASFKANKR